MPAQDRKGPRGQGPRTGWGLGLCRSQDSRMFRGRARGRGESRRRGWGQGRGPGRGQGRGLGRWWGAEDVEQAPLMVDVETLRSESSRLKAELEAVEARLSRRDKQD